jgi:hypothetical protein
MNRTPPLERLDQPAARGLARARRRRYSLRERKARTASTIPDRKPAFAMKHEE